MAYADFSDVDENNPHKVAIETLVEQVILRGYDDGTFRPDQDVTRAEAIKIALLAVGITAEDGPNLPALTFSDVSNTDWFYDYLKVAVNLGIAKGYDDGSFQPNKSVNRAEAMKLILSAASLDVETPVETPFADVATDAWFAPYVNYGKTLNISVPQTDGLWHPEENVSRAEVSEMVYRLQLVQTSGTEFDEATNWPTEEFTTVSVSLKVPFGWSYKQDGVGAVWLLDSDNSQYSMLDPYENGGTLLMTRYMNTEGKSSAELFDDLQADLDESTSEGIINGFDTLVVYRTEDERFREWYVVVPNNSMLHFVAYRGDGFYSPYLESYLEKIVKSLSYVAQEELGIDEKIEAIRGAIQVDGSGEAAMSWLDDWELIETDAIGVGTGPVDYFYSESADMTVKYERSFDVILDVRDGETTAF